MPAHRFKKPSILMVDDHEENLKVLASILMPQGYDLIPANSGKQTFKRLENRIPDLILLDVILPDINGVEICRKLKAMDDLRDIPVIFLSAADDKELVVEALESGGVDYIAKPFNQAELLTRVRTHVDLKQARDEMERLAADKDQLLRVLAHDLKNQISGVLMSSRLLLDREECQQLPDRSLKLIRNVSESSETMMGFMKSFLANQETANQTIELRSVDHEELLTRVMEGVESSAVMKQTQLVRGERCPGWRIQADGNACRQVFENLIENAVKFCPHGSRVEVSSRLNKERNTIEIEISDNGPGFKQEDRKRLFQKYAKLSARPSAGEPSTGLGLYIVKSLMESMGGDVRLEGGDLGATFILRFRARELAEIPSE